MTTTTQTHLTRGLFAQMKSCVLALCIAFAATQAGAMSFTLTPSATTVALGTAFSLDLVGTDLADLYAFQFALSFDPAVIHVSAVTEGPVLSTAGTTFFVPGALDNVGGKLELTGNTLIGPTSGFTGSGVLARISFLAFGPGFTDITLTDALTLDSGFGIGDPTLGSARDAVTGVGAIPEPSTYALFVLGLLALASVSALRRHRG